MPSVDELLNSAEVTEATLTETNAIAEESTEELIKQIEAKGNKTLESIPKDYTVLEGNVDKLKEDLSDVNNSVSTTADVYTIASADMESGTIDKITNSILIQR